MYSAAHIGTGSTNNIRISQQARYGQDHAQANFDYGSYISYNALKNDLGANILTITLKGQRDIQRDTASAFKKRRLLHRFTQSGLAKRSGVSLGSLKRFENTGEISFYSLLSLALVLDCLNEFEDLGALKPEKMRTMKELLASQVKYHRGSKS